MIISTSDILAALAILISIITAMKQWRNDIKMNRINLEAEYFKQIYSEHLLKKLPKARGYVQFKSNGVLLVDDMTDELNMIRQDSIYFFYADNKFYEKLKSGLGELEDYLVACSNQIISDTSIQKTVMQEIEDKLNIIYDILTRKYYGK